LVHTWRAELIEGAVPDRIAIGAQELPELFAGHARFGSHPHPPKYAVSSDAPETLGIYQEEK
jgi:hypothetical protein